MPRDIWKIIAIILAGMNIALIVLWLYFIITVFIYDNINLIIIFTSLIVLNIMGIVFSICLYIYRQPPQYIFT